jgi:serine/threonine protein kinase
MIETKNFIFVRSVRVLHQAEDIVRIVEENIGNYLTVVSYRDLGLERQGFSLVHKKIANIRLDKPLQEVVAGWSRGTRQEIERTRHNTDFKFRIGDSNHRETYEMYCRFEKAQGRQPWKKSSFRNTVLCNAYYRGKLIASVPCYDIFPYFQVRAIFSERLEPGNENLRKAVGQATRRLIYEICAYAKERGYEFVGLGSVNFSTGQKSNVAKFKMFFNPAIEDEYTYVYKSPRFLRAEKILRIIRNMPKAGERAADVIRVSYNALAYSVLGIASRFLPKLRVFPQTNGDCLTYAWGEHVYKWSSPFFFFNPRRNFGRFARIHDELRRAGISNIPDFRASRFHIRYQYIDSQDLLSYLKSAGREEKIDVLQQVIRKIDAWHQAGFAHLDFKPKNILVARDSRIYFIDFENVISRAQEDEFLLDYDKLLPRIAYLFAADEFEKALSDAPARILPYAAKYLRDFTYGDFLRFDWIEFEKGAYEESEDVDITVQSLWHLDRIVERATDMGLDHFLFFRSRDDIKLYVHTLRRVILVDVHLRKRVSRIGFWRMKAKLHPPVQLALTGPDGSGKTTVLAQFRPEDFPHMAFDIIHAGRFAKGMHALPKAFLMIEKMLDKLTAGYFSSTVLYRLFLRRSVVPIILIDRSFFDDFLDRHGRVRHWISPFRSLLRFAFRRVKIVLLYADPAEAASRKGELSQEDIARYYRNARGCFGASAEIRNDSAAEAAYRLAALVLYLRLTPKKFL